MFELTHHRHGSWRRPVIAAALLAAVASPAHAQFRLSGGINLTRFFGDDVGSNDRRRGLDLGGSFPLVDIGPFQVRAEGYYRQKGARGIQEFQQAAANGQTLEIGIDYVEVPVLLRLGLPSLGNRLFPYLEGGPAFAWRIDCGVQLDGVSGSSTTKCDDLAGANLEETLKDYEQGIVFGAGFDVPVMNIGAINIDARYTRGLSRIMDNEEIRNTAFSMMLGYSFGLPSGYGGPAGPGFPGR